MGDIFWLVILATLFGAIVSWAGRTVLAVFTAYFVIGCVSLSVVYLGYEIYNLVTDGKTLASSSDMPLLHFVYNSVDIRPLASFFASIDERVRGLLILLTTLVFALAASLPFIGFLNSIINYMGDDQSTKSSVSLNAFLRPKISKIENADREILDKIAILTKTVEEVKVQSEISRSIIEYNKPAPPIPQASGE